MRTETLDRSRGGMWPWLGQRVTAVVIIVTIMVHLVLTHFVAIGELSYDNIGERLATTRRARQRRAAPRRRRLSTR